MTERKMPSPDEARRFWTALAEDVASTPKDEIMAELREEGEDPSELASAVRQLLRDAVKEVRQQPLREARQRHAAALKKLFDQTLRLPADMLKKRAILTELFARRPDLVTAQFRDLEGVSDSDIDGMLRQMAALGILDELDK
jgi:hypothetical protein